MYSILIDAELTTGVLSFDPEKDPPKPSTWWWWTATNARTRGTETDFMIVAYCDTILKSELQPGLIRVAA
jgi:hypothetical protein